MKKKTKKVIRRKTIRKKAKTASAKPRKKPAAQKSPIYKIREECLFRTEMDRQITVLNPEGRTVGRLRDMSAYIWTQLDGSASLTEVAKRAQKQLGIKSTKFPKMIESFARKLLKYNLIQTIPKKLAPTKSIPQMDLSAIKKDIKTLESAQFVVAPMLPVQ